MNGLLKLLPKGHDAVEHPEDVDAELRGRPLQEMLAIIRGRLEGLDATTLDRSNRKAELELTATTLERYARILRRLQPLEDALPELEGFEMTVLLLQKEFAHLFEQILPKLREIAHNQFEYISAELDETTIAAITIFNKWYSREVHAFLFSQNVNEVRIPPDYSNMPIDEAIAAIGRRQEAGREEIARIDASCWPLEPLAPGAPRSCSGSSMSSTPNSRSTRGFARTEYTFVVKGWLPGKSIPEARRRLRRTFGGRVVLTELSATSQEMAEAPISFANPFWARPFEFFSRLMGSPRYYETDPIPFMAIFFPIFFGLIVADVGYGLCILATRPLPALPLSPTGNGSAISRPSSSSPRSRPSSSGSSSASSSATSASRWAGSNRSPSRGSPGTAWRR